MDIFHKIDNYLLDQVAQPSIDYLGKKLGIDYVNWAANIFMAGMLFSVLYGCLISGIVLVFSTFSVLVNTGVLITGLQQRKSAKKEFLNPLRYQWFLLRILFMTVICVFGPTNILMWPNVITIISDIMIVIAMYTLSCSDPPPKQQSWNRSLVPEAG